MLFLLQLKKMTKISKNCKNSPRLLKVVISQMRFFNLVYCANAKFLKYTYVNAKKMKFQPFGYWNTVFEGLRSLQNYIIFLEYKHKKFRLTTEKWPQIKFWFFEIGIIVQGQLHSTLIFENLKPVEISKNLFNIIWTSLKVV